MKHSDRGEAWRGRSRERSEACEGDARGHWDGSTLVVETSNLKATTRGASPALRLIERFTRTGESAMDYEVTFVDPNTCTAPWTAAVDLEARPDDVGVYEYACHEGNYGMSNMLSASRHLERSPSEPVPTFPRPSTGGRR